MVDRGAPITTGLSGARTGRPRRPVEIQQSNAPAATDRFAPARYATWPGARQRPRPDAENVGGEVSFRTFTSFDHLVCRRLSKGLQRLFAHDLGIVLAGPVEVDELPGDRSVDIVVAIAGLQDDADQFECQTQDALGLRVEPLAVEIWANRHGYLPLIHRQERDVSQSPARLASMPPPMMGNYHRRARPKPPNWGELCECLTRSLRRRGPAE